MDDIRRALGMLHPRLATVGLMAGVSFGAKHHE
jgi:hypothetical protein